MLATPEHVNIGTLRKRGYEKAIKEFNLTTSNNLAVEIDEAHDPNTQVLKLLREILMVFCR